MHVQVDHFLQLQASAKFCLALLIFSIRNVENFLHSKMKASYWIMYLDAFA